MPRAPGFSVFRDAVVDFFLRVAFGLWASHHPIVHSVTDSQKEQVYVLTACRPIMRNDTFLSLRGATSSRVGFIVGALIRFNFVLLAL